MIRRTKARALKLPSTLLPHPRARVYYLATTKAEELRKEKERETHTTQTYNRHWTGTDRS